MNLPLYSPLFSHHLPLSQTYPRIINIIIKRRKKENLRIIYVIIKRRKKFLDRSKLPAKFGVAQSAFQMNQA